MIMPSGQQLLLPANRLFIGFSLVAALLINMLINMGLWGRAAWVPDVLAVVLVFWSVHQPLRVGVATGFVLGLVMDVHQGALLGQHALSYTVLTYLAVFMHRRLLWFTVPAQALQLLPLFLGMHALVVLVRMLAGGGVVSPAVLVAPVIEALLWPLVTVLLLAPQRRAPDPDEDRPL